MTQHVKWKILAYDRLLQMADFETLKRRGLASVL